MVHVAEDPEWPHFVLMVGGVRSQANSAGRDRDRAAFRFPPQHPNRPDPIPARAQRQRGRKRVSELMARRADVLRPFKI